MKTTTSNRKNLNTGINIGRGKLEQINKIKHQTMQTYKPSAGADNEGGVSSPLVMSMYKKGGRQQGKEVRLHSFLTC